MRDVIVDDHFGVDNKMDEIIKELSKKYNKKEKIIGIMLEKSMNLGYDVIKSKENIIDFINKC